MNITTGSHQVWTRLRLLLPAMVAISVFVVATALGAVIGEHIASASVIAQAGEGGTCCERDECEHDHGWWIFDGKDECEMSEGGGMTWCDMTDGEHECSTEGCADELPACAESNPS